MPKQIGNIKVYSLKEVSEALGLSIYSLRLYVRTGKIKGTKFGNTYRITEETLNNYFKTT